MFLGGLGGGEGGISKSTGISGVDNLILTNVRTELRDEYRKLVFSIGKLQKSVSLSFAGNGGGMTSSSLTLESVVSEIMQFINLQDVLKNTGNEKVQKLLTQT